MMARKGISKYDIGFTNINMDNKIFTVIEWVDKDHFKIKFEESGYETIVKRKELKSGRVRDVYTPYLYGVGYIGECNYHSNKKIYEIWRGMLERCYNEKERYRNPTYGDCRVCEEWYNFSNFSKWYEENYYEIDNEKMHLDKDILIKGNKVYSPQTCVFVPERINELFTKSNKVRGSYPIGVSWKKKNNKFQVQCSVIENGKKTMKYLGLYTNIEEAFQVYKEFKENYIKQIADEYKPYIPEKLYNAMYNYEIEITD